MQQYDAVDREAIWAALFAYFQKTLTGYLTMSRKHTAPPALSTDAQPAFFLVQIKERRPGSDSGLPNKLTLKGYIILYVPAPVTDEVPGQETQLAATTLNGCYKAIDAALQPDNQRTGKFTLGGLVTSVYIEGDVDQDPGIFSSQAAAILPITILVP